MKMDMMFDKKKAKKDLLGNLSKMARKHSVSSIAAKAHTDRKAVPGTPELDLPGGTDFSGATPPGAHAEDVDALVNNETPDLEGLKKLLSKMGG